VWELPPLRRELPSSTSIGATRVTNTPGELLGTGRSADVFSAGLRRVVRRYRDGHDASKEADAMRYLFKKGYPVPEVFDVEGPDIVMAHLSGTTMLKTMARKPLQIAEMAKTLVRLQSRLNALAPPPFLDVKFGEPSGIMHLDLHPDNIMMTNSGPVVIDFANIAAGPASADVAQSWIIMVTSTIPGSAPERYAGNIGRNKFVKNFLKHSDVEFTNELFESVAEARKLDPNTSDAEKTRIDELVKTVTTPRP
jgi:aminoglycoside phosphotransferase (APT) family kinase protein